MLRKHELNRLELEEQLALQRKDAVLAAYVDAKSRTKDAYEAMQLAWKERRELMDALENELTREDGVDGHVYCKLSAEFEQAKHRHKIAISEYKLIKIKRDSLKLEFELAQNEHKSLKETLQRELGRAKPKRHN